MTQDLHFDKFGKYFFVADGKTLDDFFVFGFEIADVCPASRMIPIAIILRARKNMCKENSESS